MRTGIVLTFVAGILSAPYVKPVLKAAIRATIGGVLKAKTVAAGAAEEWQDLVAEASAATAQTKAS